MAPAASACGRGLPRRTGSAASCPSPSHLPAAIRAAAPSDSSANSRPRLGRGGGGGSVPTG
eukprot:scaffold2739_cov257-Pinguiococcus_pyrenoidosus.AAC.19